MNLLKIEVTNGIRARNHYIRPRSVSREFEKRQIEELRESIEKTNNSGCFLCKLSSASGTQSQPPKLPQSNQPHRARTTPREGGEDERGQDFGGLPASPASRARARGKTATFAHRTPCQ